MQYESTGKRRDGSISRVGLRRALIDLGLALWLTDPPNRTYATGLEARGKPGGHHRLRDGSPRGKDCQGEDPGGHERVARLPPVGDSAS